MSVIGLWIGEEYDGVEFPGRNQGSELLVTAAGATLQALDRKFRMCFSKHPPGAAGSEKTLAGQCARMAGNPRLELRLARIVSDERDPPRYG